MRQQRTLRTARCPTREEHQERVVFVKFDIRNFRTRARRFERREVFFKYNATKIGPEIHRKPVDATTVAEQHLRCREIERELHLRSSPPAIHRHRDGTEHRRGPKCQRIFDTVGRTDRDPITFFDPKFGREHLRNRAYRRNDIAVGQFSVGINDIHAISESAVRSQQQLAQRPRPLYENIHENTRDAVLFHFEKGAGTAQRCDNLGSERGIRPTKRVRFSLHGREVTPRVFEMIGSTGTAQGPRVRAHVRRNGYSRECSSQPEP